MTPINTPQMTATLRGQMEMAAAHAAIDANLKELGYGE